MKQNVIIELKESAENGRGGKIGSSYIFSQQKIKAETSLTMIKKKNINPTYKITKQWFELFC